MNAELKAKIKKIKLLILDVDGILTRGDIILDEKGKEIKVFKVLPVQDLPVEQVLKAFKVPLVQL